MIYCSNFKCLIIALIHNQMVRMDQLAFVPLRLGFCVEVKRFLVVVVVVGLALVAVVVRLGVEIILVVERVGMVAVLLTTFRNL